MNDDMDKVFQQEPAASVTPEEFKMSLDAETERQKNRNGMYSLFAVVGCGTAIVITIIIAVAGGFV